MKKWSKFFYASLCFLLSSFIFYGIEAFAIENIQSEALTQIIYSENGRIENNGIYQLDVDFYGIISIANSVNEVKVIGNGLDHQHNNTAIFFEDNRSEAVTLTIEDLYITAPTETHGIDFGNTGSDENEPSKLFISGRSKVEGQHTGIHVPQGVHLIIDTVEGDAPGEIDIESFGLGAGIGGGYHKSAGMVTIEGGTIKAIGKSGIGGGGGSFWYLIESGIAPTPAYSAHGGNLIISGGTVTAIGSSGAGIGGGWNGNGGTVTITGGTVTAIGGTHGAGIGGGVNGEGCLLVITDATVMAEGVTGIGGGLWDSMERNHATLPHGGTIEISGGTVTATGLLGAGIGTVDTGSGGIVNITGSTVTAIGGTNITTDSPYAIYVRPPGIGTSDPVRPLGSVSIINSNVTAEGAINGPASVIIHV
ncbi:hypothetical protein SAMN05660297_03557 [Natronincola peptidivorans]|uniref:Uncharacterized protein n=1 Tax=Natronincola peptidivorans TaxID=426128 RepID=A0A1I0H958_9FIRM|nr:hypothetical protein [Natronincola peptidivorans]SET80205.1 hypothetical protein SAMN05660297_03557 [Natronincola peptidivorans]